MCADLSTDRLYRRRLQHYRTTTRRRRAETPARGAIGPCVAPLPQTGNSVSSGPDGGRDPAGVRALHQRRDRRACLGRAARADRAGHRRSAGQSSRGERAGRRPRCRRSPARRSTAIGAVPPPPSARACSTPSPTRSSPTARSWPSSRRATSARRSRRSKPNSVRRSRTSASTAPRSPRSPAGRTRSAARCSSTR
jgi:hypothetical protein